MYNIGTMDRRAEARKHPTREVRGMPLMSSVYGGQKPLPTGREKQEVAWNEENSMGGTSGSAGAGGVPESAAHDGAGSGPQPRGLR